MQKLRDAIFKDENCVSKDVLWECLVDPHDEMCLRSFLLSLAGQSEADPRCSTSVISWVIALKRNLLQHAICLMTTNSLVNGAGVKKEHFVYCLRQSCFLLEILPKLRGGYFALQDGTVRIL